MDVLLQHGFQIKTMATIPVNLEYDAWFAVINANQTSEMEPISLHDHLLHQPWFLHLELVTHNKTLIITTKPNLLATCAWIDMNLETMICKSILLDIEPPPSHLLPCWLDKPVYMVMSRTYANILKQQFSLDPNVTTQDTANNCPPCKWQATWLDYDLDQLAELMAAANHTPSNPQPSHTTTQWLDSSQKASSPTAMPTTVNYDAELLSLKTEINSLWTIITIAVEQIKMSLRLFRSTISLCQAPWRQTLTNPQKPPLFTSPHSIYQPLFMNLNMILPP